MFKLIFSSLKNKSLCVQNTQILCEIAVLLVLAVFTRDSS